MALFRHTRIIGLALFLLMVALGIALGVMQRLKPALFSAQLSGQDVCTDLIVHYLFDDTSAGSVPNHAPGTAGSLIGGASVAGTNVTLGNDNAVSLVNTAASQTSFSYVFTAHPTAAITYLSNGLAWSNGGNTQVMQLSNLGGDVGQDGCHITQGFIASIAGGSSNAGLQVAVGTNGIVVYEHAGSWAPIILYYAGDVVDKQVALVQATGQSLQLYVNGTLVSASTQSTVRTRVLESYRIGMGRSCYDINAYDYAGTVDEFRVYGRALTAAEVSALASGPYDCSGTDLAASVTGAPTTLKDGASGTFTATVTNGGSTTATSVSTAISVASPFTLSTSDSDCSIGSPAQTATCTKSSLAASASDSYVFTLTLPKRASCKVPTSASTSITETVSAATTETDSSDNTDTASVTGTSRTCCGDGTKNTWNDDVQQEQCDDGNTDDGDDCSNACIIQATAPVCGNGATEAGEECDDGNNVNTDACVVCKNAKCGDGKVQAGVEQCDEGANNVDASVANKAWTLLDNSNIATLTKSNCLNTCKKAQCGNGADDNGKAGADTDFTCYSGKYSGGVHLIGYNNENTCPVCAKTTVNDSEDKFATAEEPANFWTNVFAFLGMRSDMNLTAQVVTMTCPDTPVCERPMKQDVGDVQWNKMAGLGTNPKCKPNERCAITLKCIKTDPTAPDEWGTECRRISEDGQTCYSAWDCRSNYDSGTGRRIESAPTSCVSNIGDPTGICCNPDNPTPGCFASKMTGGNSRPPLCAPENTPEGNMSPPGGSSPGQLPPSNPDPLQCCSPAGVCQALPADWDASNVGNGSCIPMPASQCKAVCVPIPGGSSSRTSMGASGGATGGGTIGGGGSASSGRSGSSQSSSPGSGSSRSSSSVSSAIPCATDAQCPNLNYCSKGFCTPGCRSTDDCSIGICKNHQCTPCKTDPECTVGNICVNGVCKTGCTQDAQCPTGFVCRSGRCGPPPSSSSTSQVAVASSATSSATSAGYCCINNACVSFAGCSLTQNACSLSCGTGSSSSSTGTSGYCCVANSCVQFAGCSMTQNACSLSCGNSSSSTQSSSSSVILVAGICLGDECSTGGDTFCATTGQQCVSDGTFPCLRCVGEIIAQVPSSAASLSNSSSQTFVSSAPTSTPTVPVLSQLCGNGTTEPGEQCDNGPANSDISGAGCRTDCSLNRCGDSVVDTPVEECDAGSANGGLTSGCDARCRIVHNAGQVLPGTVIELPFTPTQTIETPNPITSSVLNPPQPPANTTTGPGTLAIMAAGAAGGYAWMRKKRKS